MKPGSNLREHIHPLRLSIQSQTNISDQHSKPPQLAINLKQTDFPQLPPRSKISDFSSKSPRNPPLRTHSSTDNSAVRISNRVNEYHMSIKTLTKPGRPLPFQLDNGEPLFYSKIEDRSGLSQIDMRRVQSKLPNKLHIQRKIKAEKRNRKTREGRFHRGLSERLASVKKMRSQSSSNKALVNNFKNIFAQSQSGTDQGKSSLSKVLSIINFYLFEDIFQKFQFNYII